MAEDSIEIGREEFGRFLTEHASMMDAYLEEFFSGPRAHPDMVRYLYGPLGVYTANGGKRHRPLVCLLACQAVGGDASDAMASAAAIEHFHTAALIHDDIADEALLRRGKPALHITEGIGLAINDGDLSLSLVTGAVISDPHLPDNIKLRVLKEVIDMTARTVEGQALDIGWARDGRFDINVDDYLAMAKHKTAFYSGGVPLAVGGIIGGGTEEQVEGLREYGMSCGLAFQIQDDILNLVGESGEKKKDYRSDITEGKRTLVMVHALQASPDREELIGILASKSDDPSVLQRAVDIADASGSIEYAHDYAVGLACDAKTALCEVLPDTDARRLLLAMADFFVMRTA